MIHAREEGKMKKIIILSIKIAMYIAVAFFIGYVVFTIRAVR